MVSEVLRAALEYADSGIPVLPLHTPIIKKDGRVFCTCHLGIDCESKGKHPRYDTLLLPNGVHGASIDPTRIKAWWEEWPNANVGIATGTQAGFIALDQDSIDTINAANERGIPPTPRVRTGNGQHALLKHPGFTIPNKVKIDGFDLRADGGLIVAPPSLHASGKRYEWIVNLDTPLADVPDWLAELLQRAVKAHQRGTERLTDIDTPYGLGALKRAVHAVTAAHNGTRNNTLYENAASMYNLVAGGELTDTTAYQTLYSAATQVGLDEAEILKTLESAKTNGSANPRNAPKQPADLTERAYPYTDLGNAQRLHALYGDKIHYVDQWGCWVVWNGAYWKKDTLGNIGRMAHDVAIKLASAAFAIADEEKRKTAVRWAMATQSRKYLDNMVAITRDLKGIRVNHDAFDSDHWLLNVRNGVIDLRTGELRQHQQSDLITKLAPVEYNPSARSVRWLQFLDLIFNGDQALIDYVQRAVGYSITGDTSEDALHFAHGAGGNGKSTFFNTLKHLLGDYAHKTPSTMLMATKYEGIPVDVADLQGKRFVVASELSQHVRWNEAKIKDLTGGDELTARYMRANPFTFFPTHKLWVYGNYKPTVVGSDEGIWRRMRLIPFVVQIPPSIKDGHFEDRLIPELPGILNWCIEGCLRWQQQGLDVPAAIDHATTDYREEMDRLQAYIDDYCKVHPNERVTFKILYDHYAYRCQNIGEYKIEKREFRERLERKGFQFKNGKANVLFVLGIRPYTSIELQQLNKEATLELSTIEV